MELTAAASRRKERCIYEETVQEIPADKTVRYKLPAQAVEMKTAVVGMVVPATAALIIYEFGNPET